MNLTDIIQIVQDNSLIHGIVIIAVCFIKIPKIKLNVWGIIGKSINKDVTSRLNKLNNELSELKNDLSVSELCEMYFNEGTYNKKQSTIEGDRSRIRSHVIPLIGSYPVKSLNKQVIEKLLLDITNGKTAKVTKSNKSRGLAKITGGRATAKRTFETISSILTFAERRELIEKNPALGIPKPKLKAKEVFLTADEYKELGKAIEVAQKLKLNQTSINAIKLLALTGCRKNEILSLKWEYVDF